MRISRGFSLIEILVVLAIIGIAISFALLALGDFGASRRATVSAEQFSSYLKLAQQQAILESSTLAIHINRDSYVISRFIQGNGWQPLSEKSIFHRQYFPKQVIVHLRGSNRPIVIDAAGDMTAFQLDFGTEQKAVIVSLVGKSNGQLTFQYPTTP